MCSKPEAPPSQCYPPPTTMSEERRINEYLFHEFGLDDEDSPARVSAEWPFKLRLVGPADSAPLFAFEDDEPYFVITRPGLTFFPAAGMAAADILIQQRGSSWLAERDPVDMATSRIGTAGVPPAPVRKARLEAMVAEHGGALLEGLFLVRPQQYLCLASLPAGEAAVLGLGNARQVVPFPDCSSWRRLAWGVGAWLGRSGIESAE